MKTEEAWISKGNALLARAMKREQLRRADVAELMNRELEKLGSRPVSQIEVGHWVRNRRTIPSIAPAVALNRVFDIPVEAWIRRQAG